MRLTNKQLNLIVDMIYNNIYNETRKNKIIKEKEAFIASHMEQFKMSVLYKDMTAVFEYKSIEWAGVLERDMYTSIEIPSPYSPTSTSWNYYRSIEDLEEKAEAMISKDFKETNSVTRTQIENKVMLSTLNIRDINIFIEDISNSFTS